MADVNDLYKEAQKDPTVKDRWFNDVKPTFWPEKSKDSARLLFDITLYNNEGNYARERQKLAEAHIHRYNERMQQTRHLYLGLAGIVVGAIAFFAPVEKSDAAKAAAATLGIVSAVASAHYTAKLRE